MVIMIPTTTRWQISIRVKYVLLFPICDYNNGNDDDNG